MHFAVQIPTLHSHSKMKRAFTGKANYDFEERSQNAKATINFVISVSVCLSVRLSTWNNTAPSGRIWMKYDFQFFF